MNILIINQPLNNRGDESAHKALVRSLLTAVPDVRIDVLIFDDDDDTIRQFDVHNQNVTYHNFKPSSGYKWFFRIARFAVKYDISCLYKWFTDLKKISTFYKNADYILCAPGGISMGGFQNVEHLYALHYAKHFNKPLAYYGRSFGPFPTKTRRQREYKKLSEEILRYFSFLSIRDKITEKLADNLNLNYCSTVDSAFLETPRVDLPTTVKCQLHSQYIVFVPNVLVWHYNYKDRVKKSTVMEYFSCMAKLILDSYPNHHIVMLPQTFNYHDTLRDDINFFNDLKEHLNDKRIVVLGDQYGSDIQQTIISNATCVIGARYHSVVFAINNNIPFIALSYEHKIAGLLESLDKRDCMIDIVHAFDNNNTFEHSLRDFALKMNAIKPDKEAMLKAKKIAKKGFDNFIDNLLYETGNE